MIRRDVELYINEIKQLLKRGQASLMVGAGFSLNAETASPDTPLPPTWNQLKKEFVNKLYGSFSRQYRKKMSDTKTVLQLAQEYDKSFERSELNSLLNAQIIDDKIFPGKIHESLLKLPWKDVFTTNYDTLLERAASHIVERKYNPVYRCDDLALSESPRIIKLHGSIHLEPMNLILTEEDYRRYPSSYAPFVNTVQQAIMETTLCLVGFSGTDPNFLKWIGWVRDNLKEAMPPIYLIGKLNISDSEYEVMKKYNIRPVDLSVLGKKKNHKELLTFFIEKISSPLPLKWDLSSVPFSPSFQTIQRPSVRAIKKVIKELLPKWEKQREEYPKWLVAPYKYRENLVAFTENWTCIPQWCSKLSSPEDIQLLYEYNWRWEHCLLPILGDNAEYYEKILKRYNPLEICIKGNKFFSDNAIIALNDMDHSELCKIWIQLMFAVLRWHREEYNEVDFNTYESILQRVVKHYPKYTERLYYERALFAISGPDLEALSKIMADWKKCLSIPEWELKYATIMADLGNSEEAVITLRKLLPIIRQSIPRDKIKSDFYCLSLEGIVLTALIAYDMGEELKGKTGSNKSISVGNKKKTGSVNRPDDVGKVHLDEGPGADDHDKPANSSTTYYRRRLSEIRANYCDPNEELELFKLLVSRSPLQKSGEVEIRKFDKTTTSSCYVSGVDKNITSGYQFLRYLEETGYPLRFNNITFIDNKNLTNATKRIARTSPSLAFSSFNRLGDNDQAGYESFFSQRIVYELSQSTIDQLSARYIKAVQWLIYNCSDKINSIMGNFYNNTLKKLLEAISRLVGKASPDTQQAVFHLIIQIYDYNSQRFVATDPLRNCVERLFKSIPNNILCANIGKLLQIPVPNNNVAASFFINPFEYIDISRKLEVPINSDITNSLDVWLERLSTGEAWIRKMSRVVLFVSNELGLMVESQQKKFAELLFSKLDSYGLPEDTDFYPWVFLKIDRYSESVNGVEDKLLKLYKDFPFKIDCDKLFWALSADDQFEKICRSILLHLSVTRGTPEYRVSADCDYVWEIFEHVKFAVEELKNHVDGLGDGEKQNILGNLQGKLLYIDRIIAEIIIPATNDNVQRRTQVRRFIHVAATLRPFPSSQVALLRRGDRFSKALETSFILALCSTDCALFKLYYCALLNAYIRANQKNGPKVPRTLFYNLVTAVGMRSDDIFKLACQAITAILDFYDMTQPESNLLLQYLGILEEETLFSSEDSRFPLDSRYDYRIAAGTLAARVYKMHHDRDANAIPSVLQKWDAICHSASEFSSLRNLWDAILYR